MAQSIFTGQTPAITNGNDATPYTLGTAFSRSTSGTITHGRWYFPDPVPTGTTDFVLYPGTGGAALARASFVAPVAGAWNTVALTTPVAYTAGTVLVAAVYTSGNYVATANFFSADLVNGDITAPASENGRLDAADQYPANVSGNAACFFADVVFDPGGGQSVAPAGISVPVALGSPTLSDGSLAIAPGGVSVPVTLGAPSLSWSASVAPDGISVPVTLGAPGVPIGTTIPARGTASLAATGSSTSIARGGGASIVRRSEVRLR